MDPHAVARERGHAHRGPSRPRVHGRGVERGRGPEGRGPSSSPPAPAASGARLRAGDNAGEVVSGVGLPVRCRDHHLGPGGDRGRHVWRHADSRSCGRWRAVPAPASGAARLRGSVALVRGPGPAVLFHFWGGGQGLAARPAVAAPRAPAGTAAGRGRRAHRRSGSSPATALYSSCGARSVAPTGRREVFFPTGTGSTGVAASRSRDRDGCTHS